MKPKTIRYAALCAALSAALGVGLAFFRVSVSRAYAQAASFYTADSGSVWKLMQNGTLLRALLYVLPAAAALLLLALALCARRTGLVPGFRPLNSTAGKTVAVSSAMLFFAAALARILLPQSQLSLLAWVSAAFSIASGVAVLSLLRARDAQTAGLCLVFPLVHAGFYLLLFYRAMAHHAQSLVYDYEILAVITLMLALYYVCAAHFKKARPAGLLFFAGLSLMLTVASAVSRVCVPALFGRPVTFGAYDVIFVLSATLLVWLGVFSACTPLPQPEALPEESPEEELPDLPPEE